MRTSKNANAVNGRQNVFAVGSETKIHNSGHSEAFDRMLKKYGSGWQTRMVRAHRN